MITLGDETIDTDALINEIRLLKERVDFTSKLLGKEGYSKRYLKIEYIKFNMVENRDNLKTRLDDINKKWASKQDKSDEAIRAIDAINKEFSSLDSGVSELDVQFANVRHEGKIIIDDIVNFWNDSPTFGVIVFVPLILGFLNLIFSLSGVDTKSIMSVIVIGGCAIGGCVFITLESIKDHHTVFSHEKGSFGFYASIVVATLLYCCMFLAGVVIAIYLNTMLLHSFYNIFSQ